MKRFLAIIVLLACVGLAPASYPIGYITPGGYAWTGDGFWWHSGQQYTRAQVWREGFYSYPNGHCGRSYGCGCHRVWTPGYYYWQYTPYYPPKAQAALPSYNDPGWRSKLLDLALEREKQEGAITRSAFEQSNYMEAVNALGFRQARPNIPYYGAYGNSYSLNYGVSGNTQYGYAVQAQQTISQVYGSSDLNILYQQAAQLTAGAQRLSGEANSGFQQLVGVEGANRARVAEILAKGQMAQQILNALAAAPSSETRGYSFRIEKGTIQRVEDPKQVTPDQRAALREQLAQVFEAKCVSCHGEENPKGKSALFPSGFKCSDWFKYSNEQKNRTWELITHVDPAKRMPLGKNGGPGKPLTPAEQKALFLN